MKSIQDKTKKELHQDLKWNKKEFQKMLKEHEALLSWHVFYAVQKRGYEIIKELQNRGLSKYDMNQEWYWYSASKKAEAHLEKIISY